MSEDRLWTAEANAVALREALALARHDRRVALAAREKLALDNVLLAKRAAEAERQLAFTQEPGRLRALLGLGSPRADAETLAELHARTDENAQLQHSFFDERRRHEEALADMAQQMDLTASLLRGEVRGAEEGGERAAGAAADEGYTRGRADHRKALNDMQGVCLELRLKCAQLVDELEVANEAIGKYKEREGKVRKWKAQLRESYERWNREHEERLAHEARRADELESQLRSEQAARREEGRARVAATPRAGGASRTPSPPRPSTPPDEAPTPPPQLPSVNEPEWLKEVRERPVPWPSAPDHLLPPTPPTHPSRPPQAGSFLLTSPDGDGDDGGVESPAAADDGAMPVRRGGAAHQYLRERLAAEEARREEAEAAAEAAREELQLSSERFQQQIALLSDALAELNAKEEARRRRQQQLREQRARESGAPAPQTPQRPAAGRSADGDAGGSGVLGLASWARAARW